MMAKKKICPFQDENVVCFKNCALYDEFEEKCSINIIAAVIMNINKILSKE